MVTTQTRSRRAAKAKTSSEEDDKGMALIKAGLIAGGFAALLVNGSGPAPTPDKYQEVMASIAGAAQHPGAEGMDVPSNVDGTTFTIADLDRQPPGTTLVVYRENAITDKWPFSMVTRPEAVAVTYVVDTDGAAVATAACPLKAKDVRLKMRRAPAQYPLAEAAAGATHITCDADTGKVTLTTGRGANAQLTTFER